MQRANNLDGFRPPTIEMCVELGYVGAYFREGVAFPFEEKDRLEPRVIVGKHEPVLVSTGVTTLERSNYVAVDEPADVGRLVHIGGGMGVPWRVGFEAVGTCPSRKACYSSREVCSDLG